MISLHKIFECRVVACAWVSVLAVVSGFSRHQRGAVAIYTAFAGALALSGGTIVGDGDWDLETYWPTNHCGETEPTDLADYTRYQVYFYELGETFYRNENKTIYPTTDIDMPTGYNTVTPSAASIPAPGVPTS